MCQPHWRTESHCWHSLIQEVYKFYLFIYFWLCFNYLDCTQIQKSSYQLSSFSKKKKKKVTSYHCTLANCSSYGWFNGTNGPRSSLLLQRKILAFKTKDPSHVWIFSKIMILAGYCGSGLLLHKTKIKKNVLWGSPFHV